MILTDDQRWDSIDAMPTVMDRMVDEGLRFSNGFVPTPLCAPSRASLLSGQYAHHTGVRWNSVLDFDASDTIATRLQQAGYRTGLFGKYMNQNTLLGSQVPPGWDRWYAYLQEAYYDYQINRDGEIVGFGSEPADYSTDVLRDAALEFIDEHADEPFFLMLNPFAPHIFPIPAPRHEGAFAWVPPWRPPGFHEEDTSDKPGYVGWVRHLRERNGPIALAQYIVERDLAHQDELGTLLGVDDALAAILSRLEALGLDQDTMIVFSSDNGLHWGEHWLGGKYNAYEESIRVPLVIRYPRLLRRSRSEQALVLNVDLAPTFAELAGLPIPEQMDGESLAGFLCGDQPEWRQDFLLEYFIPKGLDSMPAYVGVREHGWKYILYLSAFEELYDLENDPHELDNLLKTEPDEPAHRVRADAMRARFFELRPPPQ